MRRVSLLLLVVCLAGAASRASRAQEGRLMPDLHGNTRVLMVFAPEGKSSAFDRQLQLIERHSFELSDSNTVVVPMSLPGIVDTRFAFENVPVGSMEQSELRKQYHVRSGEFLVLLLNETGTEQMRSETPVNIHDLLGPGPARKMWKSH